MNWDDLKCFLAVAREGQILAASRRLGIGQATLNRRLNALEAALGQNLFDRSPMGSRLTDAGMSLLVRAERIEQEALQLHESLQPANGGISGTVRIGAPDGFGVAYLASRLGALTRQHRGLTIQLVPVPRSFSLSRREADIAVTVGSPEKGRLRTRKLTDYSLGLYATRDYLARSDPVAVPDDLLAQDLIGYVDDLIYSPQLAFSTDLPVQWTSRIEVSGAVGQFEAVKSGAGIGILHKFMAASDPQLVPVLPEIVLTRSYWMVWHENLRAKREVKLIADYLEHVVRQDRGLFM